MIGVGSAFGFVKGNESDIECISYNAELAGAVGDITASFDQEKNFAGLAIGPAAELGGALSITRTKAVGLNDLGEWLGGEIYDLLHRPGKQKRPNCRRLR